MHLPSRLRFILPLALIAVLSVGLVACGSKNGGGKSADEILNDAFSGKKKVDSGKLDVGFGVKLNGSSQLKGPIKASLNGAFESQGKGNVPDLDLKVNASAQGQSFNAGLITTGDKAFVNYQGQDYTVPAQLYDQFKQSYQQAQQQRQSSTDTTTNSLAALGISPRGWLNDAKVEDDTDVEGTKTYHVSAQVDVGKMLDDINTAIGKASGQFGATGTTPQQIPDATKQQITDAVKEASFDVYVGADDDIIRKLDLNVTFDVPANLQAQAGGLKGGSVNFDVTLADLNQKQTISAPANAKSGEELLKQLGVSPDQLGSLGSGSSGSFGGSGSSGSSGGSGSSGSTTTPSDKQTQEYLDCLRTATGSSELERCNQILR